ncbi:hypothetical protein [Shewanella youngdeokensis]|uniref:Uncharacterized protein n=1 Tax=Shewanella youngdeokensis TaxID=2999068 RepID=A0ABZ0JWB0_9GAMM|nr:hypothetical protein RGE70_14155 [Shewanella sp. DAU334]
MANRYSCCNNLNPKEQILSLFTFTSSKQEYSKIDCDMQHFALSDTFINHASHQYAHETAMIFKMIKSSNRHFMQSLTSNGYVSNNIDEITEALNNMRLYERGFSLNFRNKNIMMPICDDKQQFYKFICAQINSLQWNVDFDIDTDKVISHCNTSAKEIIQETSYSEEISKINSIYN